MKKLVFLGHSILAFFTKERIGDWQIVNFAQQGIIAKEGLKILQNNQETFASCQAILIMFGINELYYQMKEETIITYLEKIIVSAQKINSDSTIVLSQVIQTQETNRLKPIKIDWVNQQIALLAKKYDTKILSWEFIYNKEGKVKGDFTIDGIHITAKAYDIFEKELLKIL